MSEDRPLREHGAKSTLRRKGEWTLIYVTRREDGPCAYNSITDRRVGTVRDAYYYYNNAAESIDSYFVRVYYYGRRRVSHCRTVLWDGRVESSDENAFFAIGFRRSFVYFVRISWVRGPRVRSTARRDARTDSIASQIGPGAGTNARHS